MPYALLRGFTIALLTLGLSTLALAETSNWGLNRAPDILARIESTAKAAPKAGGGGSGTGVRRPAAGAPATITIVTQPPQSEVRLETGKMEGSGTHHPDLSRYKFNVQAGKRRIVVEKAGYQKREQLITITPGDNAPILIILDRESYEEMFRELIQVYKSRYEANKDDGNALLHYLYLSRLIKDYRTVDRLTKDLKNNTRIDLREETVRLQRYADETMRALEEQNKRNEKIMEQMGNEAVVEEAPAPAPVERIFIGADGKPVGKIANMSADERKAAEAGAAKTTKTAKPQPIYLNPFFYPGFVGYMKTVHLGRPDEGVYYLKGALQTEMGVPLLWYDTGLALSDLGQLTEAYNAQKTAYMLDENHAWVLSEYSYLSNLLGRINKDRTMINDAEYFGGKAVEKDPQYVGGHLNLVSYYQMNGNIGAAESQIQNALRIEPNNPELYGVYGDLLVTRGDLTGAKAQYEASLSRQPGYAYGLFGLGKVAQAGGDTETAWTRYYEAHRADPYFVEPVLRLAWLAQQGGQDQQALDLYYQASQINETLFDPYYQSGVILMRHKKWAEAGSWLYRAFQINSEEPWVNYNLGYISQQLGDRQKALDFYDAFLQRYSTQDEYYQQANSFVKSAKTLFNLVPSKYQVEGAAPGDTESFMDQFFGEETEGEGGLGGDLTDNFRPSWAAEQEPPRGNIQ